MSTALLVSPLVTACIGRFGTNPTLRIGVVLEAISFIGASFSTQIWQLILSQGVCFGIGLGFCFTSTVGVVPQWFTKRRSFANAISAGGSGFGGLIYALSTNAMISNLGLEWAFRILAVIAFVVNGACSLVLRDRNKAVGSVHVAFHLALFKQPEFWLFVGWGFCCIISYTIVVFSITDYALTVGFTAEQGSIVSAIFNLSQGIGRPLIGLYSDKFGRFNVAGLSTLIAGIAALSLWIFAGRSYAGLIVYSIFGLFAGCIWPCVAPVGAEVVGLQLLPSALSIYWLVLVLPATFAEVIGLTLRTPGVNGYLHAQLLTGFLYIGAFMFLWLLRSWKLDQMNALGFDQDRTAGLEEQIQRRPKNGRMPLRTYMAGLFAVKHV
ncbi:major facilitator superfamily domain-containing protein [Echria macrotheca]|uniref:Major facilitator superfamily domain-containing protein n=1 Tax=Echria macrotheca TaxID=438768 RepID=A0AAJ0BFW4_9PEZI|nr:major facilitator superfamily domain-containing protein [Echria macrotheca]